MSGVDLQGLIQAGREDRPTAEDRTRVRRAVAAAIAAPSLPPPVAKSVPAAATTAAGVAKVGGGLLVVGLLASAGSLWIQREEPKVAAPRSAPTVTVEIDQPPALLPSAAPLEAPATSPLEEEAPPTRVKRRGGKAKVRATKAKARLDLRAELALLSAAKSALGAREYGSALDTLDEHRARFPKGLLATEQSALRIFALCGLGRHDEAKALTETFLETSPASPLATRVKNACGGSR